PLPPPSRKRSQHDTSGTQTPSPAFSCLKAGRNLRHCDHGRSPPQRRGKALPRRQRPRLRALASPSPASRRLRVRGRRAAVATNARRAIDDPAARTVLLTRIGERDSATPKRRSREGSKRRQAVRRRRGTRVTERHQAGRERTVPVRSRRRRHLLGAAGGPARGSREARLIVA
ncbi:unnamed protein product, partial [Ectocarpus fasciculatus]